ncbi:hypothetical protein CPB85DRAFT_238835 [Mucidula mucida]|nr:hypothetical protein CPB85DRAFT_238835 [Mucidula mucida]
MSCCTTPILSYEEQYRPQCCALCDQTFNSLELLRNHLNYSGRHPYCETCHRGLLNMNSYRVHLVVSDYHHFCDVCEKEFKAAKALEILNEQSPYHSRDYEMGDRDHRPEGWEDAMAEELERQAKIKDPIDQEGTKPMSRVEFSKVMLSMKVRLSAKTKPVEPLRQDCSACLTSSRKISVTRCGHFFCSSCIKQTFEKSQGCPSCRKAGTISQLRKVQLRSH